VTVTAVGAGDGQQHAAVRRDDVPGLADQVAMVCEGVADGDQYYVRHQQVERPEPDEAVPAS
jgi:hypothetical protein